MLRVARLGWLEVASLGWLRVAGGLGWLGLARMGWARLGARLGRLGVASLGGRLRPKAEETCLDRLCRGCPALSYRQRLAGVACCMLVGTLLSLAGSGNGRAVAIEARIEPSLDYLAEITASGLTGTEADALLLYGFERQDDDTLVLIQQGHALLRE